MGLEAFGVSDAAKRLFDTYALHRVALGTASVGKWFAVRLSDGVSNGELYDTRRECIRHQSGLEMHYCYIRISPGHMTHRDAEATLSGQRKLYAMGHRMTDPDDYFGGRELIKRVTRRDQANTIRAATGQGPASNLIIPGRG